MKKENIKEIIGKKIKEERENRGFTQEELSKIIGISRSYLSDVENGRYMPSVKSLVKIGNCLNMDLNFLYLMTDN